MKIKTFSNGRDVPPGRASSAQPSGRRPPERLYSMLLILLIFAFFFFSSPTFASVDISIQSIPQLIPLTQEFDVQFKVVKTPPSIDTYNIKARIGSSSATLQFAETFNALTNKWLSDTGTWSDFPFITLDTTGIATGTIKVRGKNTGYVGLNQVILRLNKNGTNYDSPSTSLVFLESPTPTSVITPTPMISPTNDPTPPLSPTSIPTLISHIYLSEVMVYPESNTSEWIELYNNNNFEVYLSNWYVDDVENAGSSPKSFSLIIPAKSYGIIDLTSSIFNNDQDEVRLLNNNHEVIDSFEYVTAEKNISFGRQFLQEDTWCKQAPTKYLQNSTCIVLSTPIPTSVNNAISEIPTSPPISNIWPSVTPLPISLENEGNVLSSQDEITGTPPSDNELTNEPGEIPVEADYVLVNGFATTSSVFSLSTILLVIHKIIKKIRDINV